MQNANPRAFEAFAADADWADRPFWMLNTRRFADGEAGARRHALHLEESPQSREIMADVGGRLIYNTPVARTLMGRREWEYVAIVEYPSPQRFMKMITSAALERSMQSSPAASLDHLLIPISAGWRPSVYREDPPLSALPQISHWTASDVETRASAFVGDHHTQMTPERARAFVKDDRLAADAGRVWLLNLLKYAPGGGKENYDAQDQGALRTHFGRRVKYASTRTFQSLVGAPDWDAVEIVEYPSRDHFLSMGAAPEFRKLHGGRRQRLSETYTICTLPALVNTQK